MTKTNFYLSFFIFNQKICYNNIIVLSEIYLMKSVLFNQTAKNIHNIYCIGRNYVEHIAELNNQIPDEPLVFLKPNASLTTKNHITLPNFSDNIHYETEMVLLMGDDKNILGVGVGLDLTARDIQDNAKTKGLPWLKAKGFKNACWVSPFVSYQEKNYELYLAINNHICQNDSTSKMIHSAENLVNYLDDIYGLCAGDLIFTGTPKGVGKLYSGDHLTIKIDERTYQITVG